MGLGWGFAHFFGDVEAVVDEGPEAEECGADLEEEGSGVAVLGEAVVLRDLLVLGVQRDHHDEVPVRRLQMKGREQFDNYVLLKL